MSGTAPRRHATEYSFGDRLGDVKFGGRDRRPGQTGDPDDAVRGSDGHKDLHVGRCGLDDWAVIPLMVTPVTSERFALDSELLARGGRGRADAGHLRRLAPDMEPGVPDRKLQRGDDAPGCFGHGLVTRTDEARPVALLEERRWRRRRSHRLVTDEHPLLLGRFLTVSVTRTPVLAFKPVSVTVVTWSR